MVSNSCEGFWAPSIAYCCWYWSVLRYSWPLAAELSQGLPLLDLHRLPLPLFCAGWLAGGHCLWLEGDSYRLPLCQCQTTVFMRVEWCHWTSCPHRQGPCVLPSPLCMWRVLAQIWDQPFASCFPNGAESQKENLLIGDSRRPLCRWVMLIVPSGSVCWIPGNRPRGKPL